MGVTRRQRTKAVLGVSPRLDFIRRWRRALAPPPGGSPARSPDRCEERRRTGTGPGPIWRDLDLLTHDPGVLRVLRAAEIAAQAGTCTLVLGESGTGKELLARGMHAASGRHGPFVPLNCGASPPELFEAELFGASRGAFTGADRERPGLALQADQGTLVLDEIEALEERSQRALLRFLDSGEIRALGSQRIFHVRPLVIAIAQPTLLDAVRTKRFRADLYFRLADARLELPPLRARDRDLPILIRHFWIRSIGAEPPSALSGATVRAALRRYTWPGNVRELAAFVRACGALISAADHDWRNEAGAERQLLRLLRQRAVILGTGGATGEDARASLAAFGGNHTRAAKALGISRQALYRRLDRRGNGSPDPG